MVMRRTQVSALSTRLSMLTAAVGCSILPTMNTDHAVAYFRTSSTANTGEDKDSKARQRRAVRRYAEAHNIEIVAEFEDPGVSGTDPIETRAGFTALMDRIEGNGVRLVLVEDASRFARDLLTQELGILALDARGVTVIAASGENLSQSDDPAKVMMRQIAGAFAQYERARLTQKLKAGRDRKRAQTGRCGGLAPVPVDVVTAAKALVAGGGASLRAIAGQLAAAGHRSPSGKPYGPESIKRMLARKDRAPA
jgi:DNA invertase Pin-like site-specific DNA recombinase